MDFARKQLEKYGWSDGKGLGKHENGISEPLKPKLKRSATGVGYDPASEFNEHWWSSLYDKAAANIEVKEKNGKTKKIKTKDDFKITNNTWELKQKNKEEDDEQYSGNFVRTEVLTGGSKVEIVRESESEEEEKKDVFKMTDEELFKACEGRTAHKGARHGLRATGKLARIAQQEAILLADVRFSGYSHAKNLKNQVIDTISFDNNTDMAERKKKKKKRKRCNSNEKQTENITLAESNQGLSDHEIQDDNVTSVIKEKKVKRKSKKSEKISLSEIETIPEEQELVIEPKDSEKSKDKTKKNKRRKIDL